MDSHLEASRIKLIGFHCKLDKIEFLPFYSKVKYFSVNTKLWDYYLIKRFTAKTWCHKNLYLNHSLILIRILKILTLIQKKIPVSPNSTLKLHNAKPLYQINLNRDKMNKKILQNLYILTLQIIHRYLKKETEFSDKNNSLKLPKSIDNSLRACQETTNSGTKRWNLCTSTVLIMHTEWKRPPSSTNTKTFSLISSL